MFNFSAVLKWRGIGKECPVLGEGLCNIAVIHNHHQIVIYYGDLNAYIINIRMSIISSSLIGQKKSTVYNGVKNTHN